jgi:Skp family chaperone for outer membrane proteins
MITETSSTVVPPEVFENIQTLNGQVENLQRELTQALEVWQATLADEKQKFEELLARKELAFQEQDGQWARQNQAYEERLAEMKTEFETRLSQTEQNATRALSDLDDAWQRDKLEWGPAAPSEWPAERRELQEKVKALEDELAGLTQERALQDAAAPTPETVKALEVQLLESQQTASSLQDRATFSEEILSNSVKSLDDPIYFLSELVQQAISPAMGENPTLAES